MLMMSEGSPARRSSKNAVRLGVSLGGAWRSVAAGYSGGEPEQNDIRSEIK